MEKLNVIINGMDCKAEKGEFLLDIAQRNGIVIPHLCHHEFLRGQAACRLCIAEVRENGRKKIVTSCIYPVMKDLQAETETEEIREMRKVLIGLLAAEVPENAAIANLAEEYGSGDVTRFTKDYGNHCILCGLCVKACAELGCNAIATVNRGITKKVSTPYDEPPTVCIGCGSCAYVCPTECIKIDEQSGIRTIWNKEFELMRCICCGRYFMTKAEQEYLRQKCGNSQGELEMLCKNCKQAEMAKKIMETSLEF
jgi:NADH dehydrogenase/NADH:ubiquinone oxidoreductase subunit G